MNVLSLFDGISCGIVNLGRVGIPVSKYYSSEIVRLKDITKIEGDLLVISNVVNALPSAFKTIVNNLVPSVEWDSVVSAYWTDEVINSVAIRKGNKVSVYAIDTRAKRLIGKLDIVTSKEFVEVCQGNQEGVISVSCFNSISNSSTSKHKKDYYNLSSFTLEPLSDVYKEWLWEYNKLTKESISNWISSFDYYSDLEIHLAKYPIE